MPQSSKESGYFLRESSSLLPAYLGKAEGINKLTASLGRPQDKGEDYKVEILNFQASKDFIFKRELRLEAPSMHKCNVINKVQPQQ